MGLLKKYNANETKFAYYPQNDPVQGLSEVDETLKTSKLVDTFDKTSLDLEDASPLGGPMNIPFSTPVGFRVITSPTTHPYTPKKTYKDSLQNPQLVARAIDPYK